MNKHRPIFQPNEISDATVNNMRARVIAGLVAIAIIMPFIFVIGLFL